MTIRRASNFLSRAEIADIAQTAVSPAFAWNYNRASYGEPPPGMKSQIFNPGDGSVVDCPQMTHIFLLDGAPSSPYFSEAEKLFRRILKSVGVGEHKLVRAKANLLLGPGGHGMQMPHVDLPCPHLVVVYYVYGDEGDTIVFDQRFGEDFNGLTVMSRERPVPGEAIVFDGAHYHAAERPSRSPERIVFNFTAVPV